MNETIEGRAPGGHGGDANGDREGVITLTSNRLVSFGEKTHNYPGHKIQPGPTQWETKPSAEVLPSQLAEVDLVYITKSQSSSTHGPYRQTLLINRTANGSKVHYFPEWTQLINLPSDS